MFSPVLLKDVQNNSYDALIVLGKNIGIYSTRHKIKKTPHFLSDRSELSTITAGLLYKTGIFKKIVFVGGKTSGKNIPSEAAAMKNFLMKQFSDISGDKIILEEKSVDTLTNAKEVKKILKENDIRSGLILTTSVHTHRTKMLFNKEGLNLDVISSDKSLPQLSKELNEKYNVKESFLELLVERTALLVQLTPLLGSIANKLVEMTRSRS
ncbi:MAG: YdcF family protein [Candidatus Levybacteria bacterium]|nr:YdcF family protein [Candidatus Levybacteria bacterium]